MSEFLLGQTEKSRRDVFIVRIGKDVFGVKWWNRKLLKGQTGWNGVLRQHTMPRVCNQMKDTQEREQCAVSRVPGYHRQRCVNLEEHIASLKKYLPVPTGALDLYEPQD